MQKVDWQTKHEYILKNDLVSLWLIDIEQHLASLAELSLLLDEKEQERASRFKFAKDRNCFIISKGILRVLLSRYLESPPESIEFITNKYGKPSLNINNTKIANSFFSKFHFNLSHSQNFALIAITLDDPIGVDIEYMQEKIQKDDIASRFFAEEEHQEYFSLKEEEKLVGFYNAWTRKEAFIKALGKGVSQSLKSFAVNLSPQEKPQIVSVNNKKEQALLWQLHAFTPKKNYLAATSWRGRKKQLKFFEF